MTLNRLKKLLENNSKNNIKILTESLQSIADELVQLEHQYTPENLDPEFDFEDSDIISLKNKFDLILSKIQSLSNEIEKIHNKKLTVNPA